MPKSRPPYPPVRREQTVALVRAGRTPEALGLEYVGEIHRFSRETYGRPRMCTGLRDPGNDYGRLELWRGGLGYGEPSPD
jgi:hypothetical protein